MGSTRPVNIGVIGSLGAYDIGADAKLVQVVRDLRQTFGPQLGKLVLIGEDARRIQGLLENTDNLEIVQYTKALALTPKLWLNHLDAVVFAGDDLFSERPGRLDLITLASFSMALRLMGISIVFYASHIGDLNPLKRMQVAGILKRADVIMLDQPDAVVALKRLGIMNEILCTASPVCAIDAVGEAHRLRVIERLHLNPHKRSVVTICPAEFFTLRSHGLMDAPRRITQTGMDRVRESSDRFVRQMAAYADWLSEDEQANVVLLSVTRDDEPVVQGIYDGMQNRYRARLVFGTEIWPDMTAALLAVSRLVVTARLSMLQMAAALGVPVLGVNGLDEMEASFRQIGILDFLLDYVTPPNNTPNTYKLDEWLIEQTGAIWADEGHIRDLMQKGGRSFRNRAERNRDYILEWAARRLTSHSRLNPLPSL